MTSQLYKRGQRLSQDRNHFEPDSTAESEMSSVEVTMGTIRKGNI